jgi:hypothetical protein
LWERYGSNEEKWICVDHTLRNLLNGGRTVWRIGQLCIGQ